MNTRQMAIDQNKKNNTTFVIKGTIEKVEVDKAVGFKVFADILKPYIDSRTYTAKLNVANFYELPKDVSHKILQNIDRKVRITIELIEDEDYL